MIAQAARAARSARNVSRTCGKCGHENALGAQTCKSCRGFLAGNQLAITHGTKSIASMAAAVAEAELDVEGAIGDGPGSERRYALARQLAARALARMRLLERFLDERGLLDSKGRPRPAAKMLGEAHAGLLRHLEALGLTPSSAAKLGVNLTRTVSLADALVQMARDGAESLAERSNGAGA